jgi:hypothetical protein
MSKLTFFAPLLALFLLFGGCSNQIVDASLGKQFSLHIGQTASIASEGLKITFDDVTADSRCPKNVQCIWTGQVTCLLTMVKEGDIPPKSQMVINQMGSTNPARQVFEDRYMLTFDVQPYPVSGQTISKSDYVLVLGVARMGN